MFKKTENLAWFILILSFTACLILAIGIPLGIRWGIRNSNRGLYVVLQPRSGSVTYQQNRSNNAVLVGDNLELHNGDQVKLTTSDASALILFYHPDQIEVPLATVQLYEYSTIMLNEAQTPRFPVSELNHHIDMEIIATMNTQVSVESDERPAEMTIHTPDATVTLADGVFTFSRPGFQTDIVVREGIAKVTDPVSGDPIALANGQRTSITENGLGEIYVGEYDIMSNNDGDFDAPLEEHWQIMMDRAYQDESPGTIRQTHVGDDYYIVLFTRVGQGFAETGIKQDIHQDLRGAESLQVRARLRINTQTLAGCGSLGTECPIMLAILFRDEESGGVREWLQGFYAIAEDGKTFCKTCEWKVQHQQVSQLGAWYDYESPNLLPLLREQGIDPVSIESIYIYASGHTYESAINQIAILVGE